MASALAISRYVAIVFLLHVTWWNASKIPNFLSIYPMNNVTYNATECEVLEPPIECFGLQTQMNLVAWFGYKSPYKLFADQTLFVSPHCAMGIAIEVLLLLALIQQDSQRLLRRSLILLPLTFVFVLHIWPVRDGIPDSLCGAPINETLIFLLMISVVTGGVSVVRSKLKNEIEADRLLVYSWFAIGILVNVATFGEQLMLILPKPPIPEPNVPNPRSGHDFYADRHKKWVGTMITAGICLTIALQIPPQFFPSWSSKVATRSPGEGEPKWRFNGPALWQVLNRPAPEVGVEEVRNPERYLQATGECFILMLVVSWCVTVQFNPKIFEDNILRAIVGYNNLCVGFDSVPARYVAFPLQSLQATLAVRYSTMATIRLNANRPYMSELKYWFVYVCNWIFAVFMLCFPMLLLFVPSWDDWPTTAVHLNLFMGALIICFLMIFSNFLEHHRRSIPLSTKIWFSLFSICTVGLATVGIIDVSNFHPELGWQTKAAAKGLEPNPPVFWKVCAYLDFGWFVLLGMTVIFLPDAPEVKVRYDCPGDSESWTGEDTAQGLSDDDDSTTGEARKLACA